MQSQQQRKEVLESNRNFYQSMGAVLLAAFDQADYSQLGICDYLSIQLAYYGLLQQFDMNQVINNNKEMIKTGEKYLIEKDAFIQQELMNKWVNNVEKREHRVETLKIAKKSKKTPKHQLKLTRAMEKIKEDRQKIDYLANFEFSEAWQNNPSLANQEMKYGVSAAVDYVVDKKTHNVTEMTKLLEGIHQALLKPGNALSITLSDGGVLSLMDHPDLKGELSFAFNRNEGHTVTIYAGFIKDKPAIIFSDPNLGTFGFQKIEDFNKAMTVAFNQHVLLHQCNSLLLASQPMNFKMIVPKNIISSNEWFGKFVTVSELPTASLTSQNSMPNWAKLILMNLKKYESATNYLDGMKCIQGLKDFLANPSIADAIDKYVSEHPSFKETVTCFKEQIDNILDSSPPLKEKVKEAVMGNGKEEEPEAVRIGKQI